MPEIDLILQVDTAPYIKNVKDAQVANEQFFTSVAKSKKMQKEFFQGITEGVLKELQAVQNAEKSAVTSSQRMTTQLRAMKDELTKMEQAGLAGTKAFQDLAVKAGRLGNQIGDTQQRIRVLSSDTRYLDAAMSGAQGLVGGFSLAQGAMALFGKESSNLQKQLVKVQGSMALLIGLQQVMNTLNKDNAFRVMLSAKAQDLYTLAIGRSTGAMKAFKVAMLTTGIGAIIIALGLLIANWDKVKKAVQNLFNPNAKLINQIKEQKKAVEDLIKVNDTRKAQIEREIELLEAIGDKEEEIFQKKLQLLQV